MAAVGFSKYSITAEIGVIGDDIHVFLAKQRGFDRLVEIRLLANPAKEDANRVKRFLREIFVLTKLDHPNILPVLDAGRTDRYVYYTTDHRNAVSLEGLLERVHGPLLTGEVEEVAAAIGSALQLMHSKGLVHRNITTSTVYFDLDTKTPYISDFNAIARPGTVSGRSERLPVTPEYLAKEPHTARTDLFLLGVMMFKLATGVYPFPKFRSMDGLSPAEVFEAAPPSSRNSSCTEVLDALISTLMEPAPAKRFQDAGEFLKALESSRMEISLTSLIGQNRRDIINKVRQNLKELREAAEKAEREKEEKRRQKEKQEEEKKSESRTAGPGLRHYALFIFVFAVVIGILSFNGRTPDGKEAIVSAAQIDMRKSRLADKVFETAGRIDESPVNKRNFRIRWMMLRSYVENLRREGKRSSIDAGMLESIKKTAFKEPEMACRRLNDIYSSISR